MYIYQEFFTKYAKRESNSLHRMSKSMLWKMLWQDFWDILYEESLPGEWINIRNDKDRNITLKDLWQIFSPTTLENSARFVCRVRMGGGGIVKNIFLCFSVLSLFCLQFFMFSFSVWHHPTSRSTAAAICRHFQLVAALTLISLAERSRVDHIHGAFTMDIWSMYVYCIYILYPGWGTLHCIYTLMWRLLTSWRNHLKRNF